MAVKKGLGAGAKALKMNEPFAGITGEEGARKMNEQTPPKEFEEKSRDDERASCYPIPLEKFAALGADEIYSLWGDTDNSKMYDPYAAPMFLYSLFLQRTQMMMEFYTAMWRPFFLFYQSQQGMYDYASSMMGSWYKMMNEGMKGQFFPFKVF